MADLVRYDELYHHGIKGMRWGIRRFQNKNGSLTPEGKKRYDSEGSSSGGESSTGGSTSAKPKRKRLREYTDDELKERTTRLQTEKGYFDARKNLTDSRKNFINSERQLRELKNGKKPSKPKPLSEMTDEEIVRAIDRKILENRYKELHPAQVSKGKQLIEAAKDSAINAIKTKGTAVIGNYIEKELKKALGINDKPSEAEALKAMAEKYKNLETISKAKETMAKNAESREARAEAQRQVERDKAEAEKAKAEAQRQVDEYNKSGAHQDSIKGTTYSKSGSSIIQDGPSVERGAKTPPAVTSSMPVSAYTNKSTVVIDGQSFVADLLDRNGRIIHGELVNFPDGELYHHGVKGQKWGVRRYQYSDGTLTPAGRKRYQNGGVKESVRMKVKDVVNRGKTIATGRQYVDGYLAKGTTFARIQTTKEFENFAFYATYKKDDQDKYLSLFGKNLKKRAEGDARRSEKQANISGNEDDIKIAKDKREYADNLKVYQLKLSATKKLKIPSDDNAADITAKLLKDKDFKDNVMFSIADSKAIMKRPAQQILFKEAENALKKNPERMSSSEKIAVYKALNLSLVNHKPQEIAAQDRFYGELKKKGYNALLDYNDKDYSSYHAKRPMIVFDTDSVTLSAVTEAKPKVVDKLYEKYNAERLRKEVGANTIGVVNKLGNKTVSECSSLVKQKMDQYLR